MQRKSAVKALKLRLVTQANENLQVGAALGINDMTFEKHAGFEGNKVPFAPSHTLNLAAQYNLQEARVLWSHRIQEC